MTEDPITAPVLIPSASRSLCHGEIGGARSCSIRSGDGDRPSLCAGWNRGRDLDVGVHGECRSFDSTERDLGRAGEAGSIDCYLGADRTAGRAEACNERLDDELAIGRELAARHGHRHQARGRVGRNYRCQVVVGHNGESCCCPVEGNCRRSGESLAQDFDCVSYFTVPGDQADERFQAHIQAVENAIACTRIAPRGSVSVQDSIRVLKQRDFGVFTKQRTGGVLKTVKDGVLAFGGDLENRP